MHGANGQAGGCNVGAHAHNQPVSLKKRHITSVQNKCSRISI